jgi:16S rRNA (uracil1498-N3)-methyltransferase
MKEGELIRITNGQGQTIIAEIISADKKKTKVKTISKEFTEPSKPKATIAISLIKNTNRFEWFVEKATEIGISAIIPLICKRSEKTHFRKERIRSIIISSMLQSQQSWLPEISEPVKFVDLLKENYQQKFIAHCLSGEKKELKDVSIKSDSKIILIGPEGDFTEEEIQQAIQQNYLPVSLGETRLRTETAGIVAAVLLK